MAHKGPVDFEAALYHVLDRGDRCETSFRDDRDRERFIATLGEACARTDWRIHHRKLPYSMHSNNERNSQD